MESLVVINACMREGSRTQRILDGVLAQLSKKYNVEMPIVSEAYSVLYGNADVKDAMKSLMLREKKSEH